MEHTYAAYMARLTELLRSAAPGAVLEIGSNLGAALLDDAPVCFDLDDGIDCAADFDRSAWSGDAWDGETAEQTWGALDDPQFAYRGATMPRHAGPSLARPADPMEAGV